MFRPRGGTSIHSHVVYLDEGDRRQQEKQSRRMVAKTKQQETESQVQNREQAER